MQQRVLSVVTVSVVTLALVSGAGVANAQSTLYQPGTTCQLADHDLTDAEYEFGGRVVNGNSTYHRDFACPLVQFASTTMEMIITEVHYTDSNSGTGSEDMLKCTPYMVKENGTTYYGPSKWSCDPSSNSAGCTTSGGSGTWTGTGVLQWIYPFGYSTVSPVRGVAYACGVPHFSGNYSAINRTYFGFN